MAETGRETWITGVGIVSGLGEGRDAHRAALAAGTVAPAAPAFAPYLVHGLVAVDFDRQIPKRGDQRQMEPWQRIGTYAAGLALDDAGVKGDADLLGRMDLLVAAAGGERDMAVDSSLLTDLPRAANPAAALNERLMNDLRPTLFLAQLSNLLAGNISIVHGVTGSSRTFMGEENAGVDAVRIARARIAAGQSEIALVGGAFNAERKDMLMMHAAGGFLWKGPPGSVWSRAPAGGFAPGSMGAFLVLEARAHAQARGAEPLARLAAVTSDRAGAEPGSATAALERLFAGVAERLAPGAAALLSGATGAAPMTNEERAFLGAHPDLPVRATGTYLGHGLEPQFVLNVALAADAVRHRSLPAAADAGVERPFEGGLRQVVVTSVAHWRGVGIGLVEAV